HLRVGGAVAAAQLAAQGLALGQGRVGPGGVAHAAKKRVPVVLLREGGVANQAGNGELVVEVGVADAHSAEAAHFS
nr:hypothetical protein [Tanacetum cinerariifolium]